MPQLQDSLYGEFLKTIEERRKSVPVAIPYPFNRMGNHLAISRQTQTLIGGNPGTGKSALAHYIFAYHPYVWTKNNPDSKISYKVIMFNLERAAEFYIAKWTSLYLYNKYKVIIEPRWILGEDPIKGHINDTGMKLLINAKSFMDGILNNMLLITRRPTPNALIRTVIEYLQKVGTIEWYQETQFLSAGNIKKYTPHNIHHIVIVVVDHIGKIGVPSNSDERLTAKAVSDDLAILRDKCGVAPVIVNQFNRNISDVNRRKGGSTFTFIPEEQDFKTAGNMFEDSDVVLGLMNPAKFGVKTVLDYPVKYFIDESNNNRLRTLSILKNTKGSADIHYGMGFFGEFGMFTELSSPDSFILAREGEEIKYDKELIKKEITIIINQANQAKINAPHKTSSTNKTEPEVDATVRPTEVRQDNSTELSG